MFKLNIEGMSCQHCVNTVTKILESMGNLKNIKVSLEDKAAYFEADKGGDFELIKAKVEEKGYKVTGWEEK
ncbi:MAG: P-type Cu+ transporter [Desulfonauticus sp.]|jgi:copper chaperone CopZ|nr:MAG: Copper ion binding protein [Desulfonauticus sp. 38_4375]MDK2920624.1 P-type Cu+ transporter [Desulfonauticus sp.]